MNILPTPDALAKAYDFIVVGSGSAGIPAAVRLAEALPDKAVLLVEAGGSNQVFIVRSPMITCPHIQNTELDWQYRTTQQPMQQSRASFWPRGKMLGGSSSINYMLAVRGDPKGFDQWETDFGCTGWGFKDLEPYFRRLENYRGRTDAKSGSRGRRGPIEVQNMAENEFPSTPVLRAFVKGCEECGVPETLDYNSPYSQFGAAQSQTTITSDGVRCDTATGYLFRNETAMKKLKNLTVVMNSLVARVVIDKKTMRATGVEILLANDATSQKRTTVNARCEIILSGGAVNSPQILMLSGVGPRKHLEKMGVECLVDSPDVGRHLKDHLMLGLTFAYNKNPVSTGFRDNDYVGIAKSLVQWAVTGKGMFSTSWVQALAFFPSSTQPEKEAHRIQVHFVPFIGHDGETVKRNMGIDEDVHGGVKAKDLPHGVTFLPSLLLPKSKGYLELRSSDPRVHPLIEPNYLAEQQDVDTLVEAFRFCRRVAKSKAMSAFLDPNGEVVDKELGLDPESREYIETRIRRAVITIYHPTSTCRMGPDATSVVDLSLRVRGVKGLRVADCSVFPDIVAGNTNLAAIATGERAADIVAADWAGKFSRPAAAL